MKVHVCPNCGWDRYKFLKEGSAFGRRFFVRCSHCRWRTQYRRFKWLAIRDWNRRKGTATTRREAISYGFW